VEADQLAERCLGTALKGQAMTETLVTVRRQWNSEKKIQVPLSVLHDFQVRTYSGGVIAKSPYPMLYAVMPCTAIPTGAEFDHSCRHGSAPHNILVCITQIDNKRSYKQLRQYAEAK
jgi:hypothetical protein